MMHIRKLRTLEIKYVLAKVFLHIRLPLFEQMKMHGKIYFPQRHDRYLDEHLNVGYPQGPQAFQRLLLLQEKILSGHHLKLMAAEDPGK